uniref:Uncharacterized protein n=1 Tax=Oryza brachyantha TaxID=4533 RepID=J3LT02_ORYBR
MLHAIMKDSTATEYRSCDISKGTSGLHGSQQWPPVSLRDLRSSSVDGAPDRTIITVNDTMSLF